MWRSERDREGARSQVLVSAGTKLIRSLHPHDLIISQRPHLLMTSCWGLGFLFFFFNFYCYSVTVVCIFSPSLHPTPTKPTFLPNLHPPPWFCPCVLYSSSCKPISPLPSGYCYIVLNFNVWLYFVCFFLLLIIFQLKVKSYGICPSPSGLFHLA